MHTYIPTVSTAVSSVDLITAPNAPNARIYASERLVPLLSAAALLSSVALRLLLSLQVGAAMAPARTRARAHGQVCQSLRARLGSVLLVVGLASGRLVRAP